MRKRGALSLAEVVIAVFLLGSVALAVFSMAHMAFVAQRRNENQLAATLEAQSVMAEVRIWANQPANFLGDWSKYNSPFPAPHVPEYTAQVRCIPAGRALDSPCKGLEAQWEGTPEGVRRMPRAVVPVEVTVSWSERPSDRVSLTSYVGEPKRDISVTQVNVSGPNPDQPLAPNGTASYSVTINDAQNRPMENLLFRWSVDSRYLTSKTPRDGRTSVIVRDKVVAAPIPAAPPVLPVQCFAAYAGTPIPIVPRGVQLP